MPCVYVCKMYFPQFLIINFKVQIYTLLLQSTNTQCNKFTFTHCSKCAFYPSLVSLNSSALISLASRRLCQASGRSFCSFFLRFCNASMMVARWSPCSKTFSYKNQFTNAPTPPFAFILKIRKHSSIHISSKPSASLLFNRGNICFNAIPSFTPYSTSIS